MTAFKKSGLFIVIAMAGLFYAGNVLAESSGTPEVDRPVDDFCSSFVDAAAEVRAANQKKQLDGIKSEIEVKLQELTAKTEALKVLIAERDAARAKVSDSLLKIYATVESEAAAAQLAKLDPNTAAELLIRLNPKKSGEILTIMEPGKAAKLVALMSLHAQETGDSKS